MDSGPDLAQGLQFANPYSQTAMILPFHVRIFLEREIIGVISFTSGLVTVSK